MLSHLLCELSSFPPNVLLEIFGCIEAQLLYSYLSLFSTTDITNPVFRVILTLRYSRLVVTNPWNGQMWGLARTRKIVRPELLPYYTYLTLRQFTSLFTTLEGRIFPEFPVVRKILFILACEDTSALEKRTVAMTFSYLLTSMPSSLMRTVRKIYLSMADFSELKIDFDVTSAIFWKINSQRCLFQSLEHLSLVGPITLCQLKVLTMSYRYRHFTALRSLDLTYLGLRANLRRLKIPNTVVDLDLSHNVIEDLEGFLIPHQIRCVNLSHNNLVGLVSMPFIPSLKVLNLRKNYILGIGYLSDSLEVLDISFNDIAQLDFKLPRQLKFLFTDMAQMYLMEEEMKSQVELQEVKMLNHITSNGINMMRYRYNGL